MPTNSRPSATQRQLSGDSTFDVYLNSSAYWQNIPNAVWNYKLGGYQVLKKWLSYRESGVLDRPLLPEEVQHFTNTGAADWGDTAGHGGVRVFRASVLYLPCAWTL